MLVGCRRHSSQLAAAKWFRFLHPCCIKYEPGLSMLSCSQQLYGPTGVEKFPPQSPAYTPPAPISSLGSFLARCSKGSKI